jgi:TP53 regulating kinase-like protein
MIYLSKKGLKVPEVFNNDKDKGLIVMEYIENSMTTKDFIFELLKQDQAAEIDETLKQLSTKIGKFIGILHRSEIIHGDLTTSNVLIKSKDLNEIYFIDFGLSSISQQLEDKAVDLYVLERALTSTHSKQAKQIFDSILESYCVEYGRHHDKVVHRLEQVRLRGRKRSMIG